MSNEAKKLKDLSVIRPFPLITTQEIGHENIRELHDNSLHRMELLDEKYPSGSGNGISELPHSGKTSLPELLGSPTHNNNELWFETRSISSIRTAKLEKQMSRLHDTLTPNTFNLPPGPNLSERTPTAQNSWTAHRSTYRATKSPFHSQSRLNINKAFTHIPYAQVQQNQNNAS